MVCRIYAYILCNYARSWRAYLTHKLPLKSSVSVCGWPGHYAYCPVIFVAAGFAIQRHFDRSYATNSAGRAGSNLAAYECVSRERARFIVNLRCHLYASLRRLRIARRPPPPRRDLSGRERHYGAHLTAIRSPYAPAGELPASLPAGAESDSSPGTIPPAAV